MVMKNKGRLSISHRLQEVRRSDDLMHCGALDWILETEKVITEAGENHIKPVV